MPRPIEAGRRTESPLRIAFYAPMKPPDHPVPSGDRQMARSILRALALAGHETEVASRLRAYSTVPSLAPLAAAAREERLAIDERWRSGGPPALWLAYHPYYKAPDLVGPGLARAFDIPYVTIEASHAGKRDRDAWAAMQAPVADAVRAAALNICFTANDEAGLARLVGADRLARLSPFIELAPGPATVRPAADGPVRLIAVAMMREDAKLDSYRLLAAALAGIESRPWTLSVVGDGPVRAEVRRCFERFRADRVEWLGEVAPAEVAARLGQADVFVWPGLGEAYGLVYLEAQAAGLPVAAMDTAGVPTVVLGGETGILTPSGDAAAYGEAIGRLVGDAGLRSRMGRAGAAFVRRERSLEAASRRLGELLDPLLRGRAGLRP